MVTCRKCRGSLGGGDCICRDSEGERTAPQVLRYLQLVADSMAYLPRFFIPTPDGEPYIERFILSRKPDGGATYLHVIYESDVDRDPHDHPYDFTSRIIHGEYSEETYDLACLSPAHVGTARVAGKLLCVSCGYEAVRPILATRRTFKEGNINVKRADELHRLTVVRGPVVTLVDRGPKVREWGFQTSDGWECHESYVKRKFPNAVPTEVD